MDFSGLQLGNGFELKHSRAKSLYIGKTVLCGDAANTFHPMAGQGLNLGIGDIMQLDENLDQLISGDMKVLSQYNKKRNNKYSNDCMDNSKYFWCFWKCRGAIRKNT